MKAKTWAGAVVLAVLIGVALLTTGDSPEALDAPRSSKWPAVRAAHLAKQPTCEVCGTNRDIQVHHILPFADRPDLELEPSNLISLCGPKAHGDHFSFGHLYSYQRSNPHVREDAARMLARIKAAKEAAK